MYCLLNDVIGYLNKFYFFNYRFKCLGVINNWVVFDIVD